MAIQQLHDGNPDGSRYGQSSTEKLAFYGATPVVQQTVTAIGTTTISQVSTSGIWGFSSSTAAEAFVARVQSLQDALDTLGIVGEA